MKKFNKILSALLCLAMVLSMAAFTVSAEGADAISESFDVFANQGTLADDELSISWESEHFVYLCEKYNSTSKIRVSDSDHFRNYNGSRATIYGKNGEQISKVVITTTNATQAGYLLEKTTYSDAFEATADGVVVTFTLKEGSSATQLVIEATGSQWRLSNVAVYSGEATGDTPVEPPVEPEKVQQLEFVAAPVDGTAYKLGMTQVAKNQNLYLTGAMSSFYFATTENVDEAADVYVENVDGGFKLYLLVDGVKTYIDIVVSGRYNNVVFSTTDAKVFTYNAECKDLVTNVGGNDLYLGTYGNNVTIGASKTSYINAENTCVSQYPAGLVAIVCKHVNTRVEGVKDATCTEAGFTGNTVCNDCGEVTVTGSAIEALGHSYVNVEEIPSTCTQQGSVTFVCSVCQDTYVAPAELLPHDYVDGFCTVCGGEEPPCPHEPALVGNQEATCEGAGYTGDLVCGLCGETLEVGTDIAPLGHSYVEGACTVCGAGDPDYHPLDHKVQSVVIAPTCTKWGCTLRICMEEDCNKSWATDYVAPTGHAWVAATCTEAGYCSVCGEAGDAATGHNHEAVVTAPTCTEAGYTTYTCVCGDTYVADETAALGHNMEGADNKEPTCTETGYKGSKCTRCDYTEQYETPATGHAWMDATCSTPKTCANCGLTEGEIKNHAWGEIIIVTAPTCTEQGVNKVVCSDCGAVSHLPVAELGHTEEILAAVEATCTEAGLTEGKKCSVCGEVLVAQEEIAALGHSWDEGVVTTEPTEEAAGVKTYTCANCGETKTEELPKLEHVHKHEAVVTAPTCEEGGYTTYTCACGDSYVADQVVALGHTFVDGNCTVCGSPETGDATVIIMVMGAMVLMAGAAVVLTEKKYF